MKPEIIDQLLREADDLQKKLDAVNAMLLAYGYDKNVANTTIARPVSKTTRRSTSSTTEKVRERCVPLITAQNGIPMKTRDILEILKNEGFEIGGQNEVANLSAMLSNSGEFEAIGRSGWVLKQNTEQPQESSSDDKKGEVAPSPLNVNQTPDKGYNQKGGVYGTFNPPD